MAAETIDLCEKLDQDSDIRKHYMSDALLDMELEGD